MPGEYLEGIALALGAAFCYAVSSIITKRLAGTPPHLIALIQVVLGALMLMPLVDFHALPTAAGAWANLATLGVVNTGLMYVLLYGAIQKLPTAMTGALSFIYPVVAIVVDRIAFGQTLQWIQRLGAAMIPMAAAGVNLGPAYAKSRFALAFKRDKLGIARADAAPLEAWRRAARSKAVWPTCAGISPMRPCQSHRYHPYDADHVKKIAPFVAYDERLFLWSLGGSPPLKRATPHRPPVRQ